MTKKSGQGPQPPKAAESTSEKTLKLHRPVLWGQGEEQEEVTELKFGELRAGDLEDLTLPFNTGDWLRMGARSAGVPYSLMQKLSVTDALLVVQEMEAFFDAGRLTTS